MDYRKTESFACGIATGFIVSMLALSTVSGAGDWNSLTSFRQTRQMNAIGGSLYVTTSGGLLQIDAPDQRGIGLTNVSGLGTVDITDIIAESSGQIWVSGFGRIVRLDGSNSQQFLFFDNQGELFFPMMLADDGDYLWVGSDIGLILFSKLIDGGQIQDSYQLFGDLNPSPSVFDILLVGDTIWLATSAGLAVADKSSFVSLKDRTNWITFGIGSYPELGTDSIMQITAFENSIYVGTARGLFRLDRSPVDTSFVPMPLIGTKVVSEVRIDNDSMFVYHVGGLAVLKNGTLDTLSLPGVTTSPITGYNDGSMRWVGTSDGIFYSTPGGFVEYPFTGMPGNDVADAAIGIDGQITILFKPGPAASMIVNGADTTWNEFLFPVGDRGIRIITDSNGVLWAGTWGPGIWSIDGDSLTQYTDKAGSPTSLDGVADNNLVTFGLFADKTYLFATSFLARNNNPVSIARLDNLNSPSGWTTISTSEGIPDNWIVTLDYFGSWLVVGSGSGTRGMARCFLGPDPFDKSDDFCISYRQGFSEGNLVSNAVRVVRFSPQGDLWVGTNFGLSRFEPGLGINGLFVDVEIPAGFEFGPDITAIDFDTRGNVWVGASNGLARFDATTGEFTLFTSLSSGLVSDNVRSITVDRRTNNVLVGTSKGLSVLNTRSGNITDSIDAVLAFPNPFVVRSSGDVLQFDFSRDVPVRIYTVAGELVAELTVNQSWDGRNQSGKACASGVYLYVLLDEDGAIGRGKFLLVRDQ